MPIGQLTNPQPSRPPTRGERLRAAMIDMELEYIDRRVHTDEEVQQLERDLRESAESHYPDETTRDHTCVEILVSAFLEAIKRRTNLERDLPRHYGLDSLPKPHPSGILVSPIVQGLRDCLLRFVAWADPPTPTTGGSDYVSEGGLTTHPHSWASNAVDILPDANCHWFKILEATWHPNGGPIYAAEIRLDQLITLDCYLTALGLCAAIEYYPKTIGNITICENSTVVGFCQSKWGGCNPANFGFFPHAPTYQRRITNTVDQRNKKEMRTQQTEPSKRRVWGFLRRPKITTAMAVQLFPDIDFSPNNLLEQLASKPAKAG